MNGDGRPNDFVQSLERGLSVIRAFGAERPRMTLSEVAAVTGLTRAAARRFLITLVALGYVEADGKLFSLRPRVLELGHAYLSSSGLDAVAHPHVEQLVTTIREPASVGVLDRDEVVYVVRVPTMRALPLRIAVGTRLPAYATSMGRVLLAALPARELDSYLTRARFKPLTRYTVVERPQLAKVLERVRRNGYAVTDQELEEGVQSAAAPIRGADGTVVAALNASVRATRSSMENLGNEILPHLVATARRIEADLAVLNGRRYR